MNENIELGDLVKDLVTGLEGVAIAECRYLNGCVQFEIQPEAEYNILPKSEWVDKIQIRKTGGTYLEQDLDEPSMSHGGGIRCHPQRG